MMEAMICEQVITSSDDTYILIISSSVTFHCILVVVSRFSPS